MLRVIASILVILIGTAMVFLTAVPVDMQRNVAVDEYRFFFYEDLDEAFPAFEEVDNNTIGFVLTARIREWEPGITKRIHMEDKRPLWSMYQTCWHEVEHWKLGIQKQLTEKQEHDIIHNTPVWERNSLVCGRMLLQGFKGFQL